MLLKLRTLGLFRAGVSLVPITALVRDARNRIVRHLQRDDFQVLEGGRLRTIVDFGASENAPVSVAFLFDTSGSMAVAANLAKGRDFVEDFVGEISPGADRVALFTLDKRLRHDVRFTSDPDEIYDALNEVRAWGMTSLYDAIAEALTPEQVSALASSIDVPVHVAAVVSPLDHPGAATAVVPGGEGSLSRLARWTGGESFYVSASEQTIPVARELLTAMRHQYFLAIESSATPGWYQLEVRTKRRGLTVRARTGYFAIDPRRLGFALPASTPVLDRLLASRH
jgi:hypothetical protein